MRKHPTSNIQHPTSNEQEVRRFDLEKRMLGHAARVVAVYDALPAGTGAKQIGHQLIRSGTSPYLHHGEAEAAESLDDFVHKLKICLKELRETWRALRLLQCINALKDVGDGPALIDETHQLIRIFFKSVKTARSRINDPPRVREAVDEEEEWLWATERWLMDLDPL